MKRITYLFLSIICLLTSSLLFGAAKRAEHEALAAEISPGILRFHILANSNSREDQDLKLEVRSFLLDEIYRGLFSDNRNDSVTKEDMVTYITTNSTSLEQKAETYMQRKGYQYPVNIRIADTYFPTKYYGDIQLPCGTYQAANVSIGNGEGHNWWCVLYPRLCFIDSSWTVLPESSKEELEHMVGETNYKKLVCQRPALKLGLPELLP